jgi:hypothetical protein
VAVRVTIDAGSKDEAQLIAEELPGQPPAASWRGYGVIRMRVRDERQARDLVGVLEECVKRHSLGWARLRFGDDEWMFKGRGGASRLRSPG